MNEKQQNCLPTPIFANLVWKTCLWTEVQQLIQITAKMKAIFEEALHLDLDYIRSLTLKPVSPGLK